MFLGRRNTAGPWPRDSELELIGVSSTLYRTRPAQETRLGVHALFGDLSCKCRNIFEFGTQVILYDHDQEPKVR